MPEMPSIFNVGEVPAKRGRPVGSMTKPPKHNYDNFYFVDWEAATEKSISRLHQKDQAILRPCIREKLDQGVGDRYTEKIARDLYTLWHYFSADHKPLADCTKDDFQGIFSRVLKANKSFSTIKDYRSNLYQFLKARDGSKFNPYEYRDLVNNSVMKKKKAQMRASKEILYPEEIEGMMKAVELNRPTPVRPRAFIMLATDATSRGGDISRLRIKNVERKGPQVWINFGDTKTGAHRCGLTFSAPYIIDLLREHPTPNDPEAPLFWQIHNGKIIPWGYSSIRMMLHRAAAKAGIHKKFGLHIFRGSGATMWKKMGLTDQDIESRGGWSPGSSTLRDTYFHFDSDSSHERAMQVITGQAPEKPEVKFKTVSCGNCHAPNPPEVEYCNVCHHSLSLKNQIKEETQIEAMRNQMAQMQTELLNLQHAAAHGTIAKAKRKAGFF